MIKIEDYLIGEGVTDAEMIERLKCPITRICNIYTILDKKGQRIRFRPKRGQMKILYECFVLGHKRLLVPKARQHGVSTLVEIILLDMAVFTPDLDARTGEAATEHTPDEDVIEVQIQASIVERNQDQAKKRMKTVKLAWELMPQELIAGTGTKQPWNTSECTWQHGSQITAGMSARGGTNHALHVSEWGVIAYFDPARAREIKTGALPSVPKDGYIFGESTHMGGKSGEWYDKVTNALEVAESDRTELDFWVVFLAWYDEPEYTLEGNVGQITDRINDYLDKKELECGVKFTDGQRLWYYVTEREQGAEMFSEYPTTIDECWMAPSAGLIYATDMDKARAEGRITDTVLHYEQLPVYTNWDIGAPANTVCWVYQMVGDQINLLECLYGGDDCKTAAAWTARLQRKKYMYGGHFLPHDGAVSWKNEFDEAGLENVVCLERPVSQWDNINEACGALSRCRFNKTGCADGIKGLDSYHCKEETDGVTISKVPVHNWASHPSTAFSYIFQAGREGQHVDRSAMPARAINRGDNKVSVSRGRNVITSPRGARVTVSRNR